MRRFFSTIPDLAITIRRLNHQSKKRGTSENSILLGEFAEKHLPTFSKTELSEYEQILNENDIDIFNWLSGAQSSPDTYKNSSIFIQLRTFTEERRKLGYSGHH